VYIINTLADIQQLKDCNRISASLAEYLERKIKELYKSWKSEKTIELASQERNGFIGILQQGDQSLEALGLPERLDLLMPEWVSKLVLRDATYFVAYFLQENMNCSRCLIPKQIVSEAVMTWLEMQPLEEEVAE